MFKLFVFLLISCKTRKSAATEVNFDGLETLVIPAISFSTSSPVTPYVRLYGLSLAECHIECGLRKRCTAFTYKRQYHRCDLLTLNNQTFLWTKTEAGVVMQYETDEARNIILDDCGTHLCDIAEKCVKGQNEPSCNITECAPLRLSLGPNQIQKSFLNYIGAKIPVRCFEGSVARVTDTTIVHCQSNGIWTSVPTGFCNEPCGEEGHYFDGSCYYISNMVALQRYEAEASCAAVGARLAHVKSEEEHNFLRALLSMQPGATVDYWIGGHYEGLWHWNDGSGEVIEHRFWHDTYPQFESMHPCLQYTELNGKYAWSNADCSINAFSICETRVSTADNTTSTSTTPTPVATSTLTATPRATTESTDPCEAESWLYYDDLCYYFTPTLLPWKDSKTECEKTLSQLAHIISEEEHEFVAGVLDSLDRYPGSENLAEGRRTIQSSTMVGHESELAVDGSYDDISSCAVTENEDRPWWMVELDQEVQVHRVVIKTRSNCCGTVGVAGVASNDDDDDEGNGKINSVELQWLEHLWNHENMFEEGAVRANNGSGMQEIKTYVGPTTKSTPNFCGSHLDPVNDGGVIIIICATGVVGRVVKIQLINVGVLSICEVEIFEAVNYSDDVNLALLREASQSSTDGTNLADLAVNGFYSSSTEDFDVSCSVTEEEASPWWRLDLGRQYQVRRVVIRSGKETFRLSDIQIYVEETDDQALSEDTYCGTFAGPAEDDVIVTVECHDPLIGQFVRIIRNTFGPLVLCDVQIYPAVMSALTYWIGAQNMAEWMWSDGSPMVYTRWQDGYPQDFFGDCGRYERVLGYEGYAWTNQQCTAYAYSICKKGAKDAVIG